PGSSSSLSVTTGSVDAVSVSGLGKVFTANMTGNIVFSGFAAAGTPGFRIAPYSVASLAFFGGASLAGRVGQRFGREPSRRWSTISASIETIALWSAAAVASTFRVPAQEPEAALFAIIALTAIAMGFRNATVRQLKVPDLTRA
ncbi:hypothetical protein OY671_012261, partial [Metschnikowia pulcherrima]